MVNIKTATDVSIPMRDGVELSADVFYPDDGEAHPILLHVPYAGRRNRSSIAQILNPFDAAERGFGLVLADRRGTFRSGGEWVPLHGEREDGYDLVEWIAAQPWCDGNVGMYGNSGMGVTTVQTAVAAPPHLKAVMLIFTGANYFNGWAYTRNLFELGFALHWRRAHTGNIVARMPAGPEKDRAAAAFGASYADPWSDAWRLPLTDQGEVGELAPWYTEWLEHPSYDEFWRDLDAVAHASDIQVPVLQLACWYDLFLPSQLELDEVLQKQESKVADATRLIVGPWAHNTYLGLTFTLAGDRDFGRGADSSANWTSPLAFDWFDTHLRDGDEAGEDSKVLPRVRYYVMGTNEWRDGDAWPPRSRELALHLHSGGGANSSSGDGVLAELVPEAQPPDGYLYDPLDPVMSVGGATIHQELLPDGVQDQAELEQRDDVLVYTSAPVSGLTIAGPVRVVLHAASSAVDTDFAAKLVDVSPDGYCANVCDGMIRARYRRGVSEEHLLEPGAIEEYEILLNDVAYHFASGNRIRLEIASSNFPRFGRNLNCEINSNLASADDAVVAVQTVYHDRDRPSRLLLPVVDR
jgi:putative CocE/NonD family hydrolase